MRSKRRHFLWFTAGAGAAIGCGSISKWLQRLTSSNNGDADCAYETIGNLNAVTRTSRALGAAVSMTALHHDHSTAEAAINTAFDELELIERLMSIYRPDSQLSQLNRHGMLKDPHPYFVEVLRASQAMSRRSDGAFDITVQPLWDLYSKAKKENQTPADRQVELARRQIDWQRVEVTDAKLRLSGNATRITLNGIAQGFAADKAREALNEFGIEHALINTGEFGSLGDKREGLPWRVGIQHPRREDAYIALAKLDGRCLATSGDYATTFSDDRELNHIFDPRTGLSPSDVSSVSITAPSAMLADALSTAAFVAGMDKGMELVRLTTGADAFVVLKNGKTFQTAGFPNHS